MHAADARGETEQRIYLLPAWGEAACYTDRERAVLGWKRLEAAYEALKAHITEEERVKLTLMINVINGWNNRLALGFGLWTEPEVCKRASEGGGLMAEAATEDAATRFDPLRPRLIRVAPAHRGGL